MPFGVKVVKISPAVLTFHLERTLEKVVPIRPRLLGRPAEGFEVAEVTSEPRGRAHRRADQPGGGDRERVHRAGVGGSARGHRDRRRHHRPRRPPAARPGHAAGQGHRARPRAPRHAHASRASRWRCGAGRRGPSAPARVRRDGRRARCRPRRGSPRATCRAYVDVGPRRRRARRRWRSEIAPGHAGVEVQGVRARRRSPCARRRRRSSRDRRYWREWATKADGERAPVRHRRHPREWPTSTR